MKIKTIRNTVAIEGIPPKVTETDATGCKSQK
jgi:hypothetical protein